MCGIGNPQSQAEEKGSSCCSAAVDSKITTCRRAELSIPVDSITAKIDSNSTSIVTEQGLCCDSQNCETTSSSEKAIESCDSYGDCAGPAVSGDDCEQGCCDPGRSEELDQMKDECCSEKDADRTSQETTGPATEASGCCSKVTESRRELRPDTIEISRCCSDEVKTKQTLCCSDTVVISSPIVRPVGCCPSKGRESEPLSYVNSENCCDSQPISFDDACCASMKKSKCSSSKQNTKVISDCCSGDTGACRIRSSAKPPKMASRTTMKEETMCPCCVQSMIKLDATVLKSLLSRVTEAQERFKRCCIAFADLCCAKSRTESGCCETACQAEDGTMIPILKKNTSRESDADESITAKMEEGPTKENEDTVREDMVLEVIGMDCPDCLSKVTRAVSVLSGTEVKNADGVRGLVSLSYDPRLSDVKAIQTFTTRASGFTINILDSGNIIDGTKVLVLPLAFRQMPPSHILDGYEIIGPRADAFKPWWTGRLSLSSIAKGGEVDIVLRLNPSKPIQPRALLDGLSEYGVALRPQPTDQNRIRIHRDLRNIALRTLASLILTIPILVLVWSPRPLTTPTISHSVQLALATLVVVVAWPVYSGSFRSAYYLHRADLGVLTSFSTLTSYTFSVIAFGFQIGGTDIGEPFFETVGLLITLIFAGRTLQAGTRKFGLKAVDNLGRLQPESARLVLIGEERMIDVRLLHYDDRIRVTTGEIIPTDGVIIKGDGTVDESSLTGESVPVAKSTGSSLTAGTRLQDGQLDMAVTRLVPENSISTIMNAVSSSSTGSEYQDLADRMAGWLLPIAGICCLAAFIGWMLVERLRRDQSWGESVISGVGYAIAIAAVSCPCALAIAVAMVTSVSMAATVQDGILFRSTQALLTAHSVEAIAFDKTGTLSEGVLTIQQSSYDQDPLSVQLIHSIASTSKHPVSETAKRYIESHHEIPFETRGGLTDTETIPGKGVTASFFGFSVKAGSAELTDTAHHPLVEQYLSQGMTILVITLGRQVIGIFGMKDQPRPGVSRLVQDLDSKSKQVSLVSGDNHSAVHSFAATIGIAPEHVHAGQTPLSKGQVVQQLKDTINPGKVAFVGDGINDTIALSTADISIATGSASNASAQIIILSSDVPTAIYQILSTSRLTRNHVVVSLTFCGVYFAVAILLASGVTGWRVPPAFAGLGELVSILPVLLVGCHLAIYKAAHRWMGRRGNGVTA